MQHRGHGSKIIVNECFLIFPDVSSDQEISTICWRSSTIFYVFYSKTVYSSVIVYNFRRYNMHQQACVQTCKRVVVCCNKIKLNAHMYVLACVWCSYFILSNFNFILLQFTIKQQCIQFIFSLNVYHISLIIIWSFLSLQMSRAGHMTLNSVQINS